MCPCSKRELGRKKYIQRTRLGGWPRRVAALLGCNSPSLGALARFGSLTEGRKKEVALEKQD